MNGLNTICTPYLFAISKYGDFSVCGLGCETKIFLVMYVLGLCLCYIIIPCTICHAINVGIISTLQKYKKNIKQPYLLGLKLTYNLHNSRILCKMAIAIRRNVVLII